MRPPSSRSRSRKALALSGPILLGIVVLASGANGCDAAVNLGGLEGGCLPGMVEIPGATHDGGVATPPFCIDAKEATTAQYSAFMSSGFTIAQADIPGGPDSGVSGACTGQTSLTPATPEYTPGTGFKPGTANFPVTNVSWCQAYAYCKWAGKRLCGQIGGGPLDAADDTAPLLSQWYYACSKAGAFTYPYGNTWVEGDCGGQAADSNVVAGGTQPACVGAFPGLYDMSGNVWEWTDSCASNDPGAFCHTMGGGFDSTETELACTGERNWTRTSPAQNIGIRCCLDLPGTATNL